MSVDFCCQIFGWRTFLIYWSDMSKPTLVICGSIAIDRIMNFSGRYRDLIQTEPA